MLKLSSPVPEEIQNAKGSTYGPIAASLLRKGHFSLSEVEGGHLLYCEIEIRRILSSAEAWSHEAAIKAHESARDAFRANPTPETEAAFEKVSDRQKLKLHFNKMRNELFQTGSIFTKSTVLPFVLPILSRALAALQADVKELREHEMEHRESYNLPTSTIVAGISYKGHPVQATSDTSVIVALETAIKAMSLHLEDLEQVGCVGPTSPGSLLREIVYFYE